MRKSCCIWLFCLLLLVTGCRDSRVIEELALIDTISADKAEKENDQDLLMIGVSIPKIDPRAKEPRETIFTTSRTFKEARIHISGQTSRRLVSGQVRNIMFGSELARDGIWKHIDTFVRDPSIGQRVKVDCRQRECGKAAQFAVSAAWCDRVLYWRTVGQASGCKRVAGSEYV